jgi:hypothetical protein
VVGAIQLQAEHQRDLLRLRAADGPVSGASASEEHHGWLVIFVATKDGRPDGKLLPVGWYEEATIEDHYKERPEKDLDQPYEYIFTAGIDNAYLIPKQKRSSFPTIPTEHFKRCFVYARSPVHREDWRKTYANLAEGIVARKRPSWRVG